MAAKAAVALTTMALLLVSAGAVERDSATASAVYSQATQELHVPLWSPQPVNTSYITYSVRGCPVTLVAAEGDTAAPVMTEDGKTSTVTTIANPVDKFRAAGCSNVDANTLPCPDGDAAFCLLIEGVVLWSTQQMVCSKPWDESTCHEETVPGTAPYFAFVSWHQEVSFSVTPITTSIIGSMQATDRLLLGPVAGVAYDMFMAMLSDLADEDMRRIVTAYFIPHGGDEVFTSASTDDPAATQAQAIFRTEDISQVYNTAVDFDDGTFFTLVVVSHEYMCASGYAATTRVTLTTAEDESYVFNEALDAPSGCVDHEQVRVLLDADVSDTNVELAMTGRDADVIKPITLTWTASNQNTAASLPFTLKTVHLSITSVASGGGSVVTEFFDAANGGAAFTDSDHPLFEFMKFDCAGPAKVATCSINMTWTLGVMAALDADYGAQVDTILTIGIVAYSESLSNAAAAGARQLGSVSTEGEILNIPITVTYKEDTQLVFEYSVRSEETGMSLDIVREAIAGHIGVPVDRVLVGDVIKSDIGVDTVLIVVVAAAGEGPIPTVDATYVQRLLADAGIAIDINLIIPAAAPAAQEEELEDPAWGPGLGLVAGVVATGAGIIIAWRRRFAPRAAKDKAVTKELQPCGIGAVAVPEP